MSDVSDQDIEIKVLRERNRDLEQKLQDALERIRALEEAKYDGPAELQAKHRDS